MAESRETFTIRGVDDEHEKQDVRDTLNDLDGVMDADLDDDGEASVRYDEDVLGGGEVVHRVQKMGYETE